MRPKKKRMYRLESFTVVAYNKPIIRVECDLKCGLKMLIESDKYGMVSVAVDNDLKECEEKFGKYYYKLKPYNFSFSKAVQMIIDSDLVDFGNSYHKYGTTEQLDNYKGSIDMSSIQFERKYLQEGL